MEASRAPEEGEGDAFAKPGFDLEAHLARLLGKDDAGHGVGEHKHGDDDDDDEEDGDEEDGDDGE
jgi:hypothetical protein